MNRIFAIILFTLVSLLMNQTSEASSADKPAYSKEEYHLKKDQFAKFPKPLATYEKRVNTNGSTNLWETLKYRAMEFNGFNLVAFIIFVCAILHTFLAGFFLEMAHKHEEKHKKKIADEGRTACAKPHEDAQDDVSFRTHLFHFLGEVEAIFGIWVLALVGAILYFFGIQDHGLIQGLGEGFSQVKKYLGHDINFTEPLFVIIVMAISATRPVIRLSEKLIGIFAKLLGGGAASWWLAVLTIAPILGSFITEPAAMTIAATLLSKYFYDHRPSKLFAYATLGLLFVNISVGGTLTHFAAPPVLMIAESWNFGIDYMFVNFGLKACLGILISNALYFVFFRKHFASIKSLSTDTNIPLRWHSREDAIPAWITSVHIVFLAWTVLTAHYPALFIGGFLFFIGFTQATGHHQNEVSMKSPILVGFFLGGLVIHGSCQGWWIEPLITSIENSYILMMGASLLTAFNDNAAITYLASQAPALPIAAKYAIVAGAVTGGGLTVIANAPNPAGQSILGKYFDGRVEPLKLVAAAIVPTIIVGLCFMLIPSGGMHKDPLKEKVKQHVEHVDKKLAH